MAMKSAIWAAAASALILGGCGGDKAAPGGATANPGKVRVGVIAELTGDMPAVGASCKNAAELAAKEVNDAGGIQLGDAKLPVEVVVEDNGGKAEQSVSSAQKLITEENVVAIVGPNASRYAIPAAEVAEAAKTVLVTPWSTNPKATQDARSGAAKKYVFRSCFIDPFQGRVLAKFVLDKLNAKKAAVLYDVASEYNKGIAEIFKATFEEAGGKVVAFETYTTNDKDFSAQLTKIKDAAPDVVFLPNYYSEVPLQIQQAKRLGISVPFVGSDSWGSAELHKLCGGDCEGYYFSTHYAADLATSEAQRFIAAYKSAYGSPPDDVAALTYDAFGLVFQALRDGKKADRQAVRDAMAGIKDFAGVTGGMKFQEGSGDPVKSAVIVQIKDGKFAFFTVAKP